MKVKKDFFRLCACLLGCMFVFAALDYFTRAQMQKELLRLQKEQGASILFVTHSIDEALLLGHKIVVIENGKVKKEFCVEEDRDESSLLEPKFITLKKNIMEVLL